MTACPNCGSGERVSRITGKQSIVKCGNCGKIHHMLLHPGTRPEFFVQSPSRAEAKSHNENRGFRVQEAGLASLHPHIYISVMLAFLAAMAVLLLVRFL